MNPPVPRDVLIDLCAQLAVDPTRVNRIVITPDKIEVIHEHAILDAPGDEDDVT